MPRLSHQQQAVLSKRTMRKPFMLPKGSPYCFTFEWTHATTSKAINNLSEIFPKQYSAEALQAAHFFSCTPAHPREQVLTRLEGGAKVQTSRLSSFHFWSSLLPPFSTVGDLHSEHNSASSRFRFRLGATLLYPHTECRRLFSSPPLQVAPSALNFLSSPVSSRRMRERERAVR